MAGCVGSRRQRAELGKQHVKCGASGHEKPKPLRRQLLAGGVVRDDASSICYSMRTTQQSLNFISPRHHPN
ncbi:hypothetical protein BHE74_00023201 [Ensete ventricosum]|uniref:Uncharacterized protein n=1 Tax=Ensete ventricosum TaxID=4639 RepID=A0A444CCG0_ENSVE|nr:hypothetical protein GW17_00054785 [Ensete ventricosum]RWW69213.1 hypothetical protein BHE74_00023201 [Ensete ventricosum]RZR74411.1 hypothetical protein BHM03_00036623 [Ensete ventricosum]